MNIKEFGTWLEAYYGPYSHPILRKEAAEYLQGFPPAFLDSLKAVLVLKYSSIYGKTPDVAIFEKHRAEAFARMEPTAKAIEAPEEDPVAVDGAAVMREIMAKARKAAIDSGKIIQTVKKSGETTESGRKK